GRDGRGGRRTPNRSGRGPRVRLRRRRRLRAHLLRPLRRPQPRHQPLLRRLRDDPGRRLPRHRGHPRLRAARPGGPAGRDHRRRPGAGGRRGVGPGGAGRLRPGPDPERQARLRPPRRCRHRGTRRRPGGGGCPRHQHQRPWLRQFRRRPGRPRPAGDHGRLRAGHHPPGAADRRRHPLALLLLGGRPPAGAHHRPLRGRPLPRGAPGRGRGGARRRGRGAVRL
ncbi:MAG: hypothetical protein AVDCRST_MAG59-3384, partial [uncultured Thermomicrobiales bacterium]